MGNVTRRDFLKIGAGAGAAIGASGVLAACGSKEQVGNPAGSTASKAKATVTAIRGTDLDAMTRQALAAVGGIGAIVKAGESVFIKPNFVTMSSAATRNVFTNGECTKIEIVLAVADECLKAGAREVTIGDGAQAPSYSFKFAKTLDGKKNLEDEAKALAAKYGKPVKLACLETDTPEWVQLPSKTGFPTLEVSGLVTKADKVISIPVLKTHQYAVMTLACKCFVGTTHLAKYQMDKPSIRTQLHLTTGGIDQVYLDVVAGVKPALAIIDGSIGLEGNGPGATTPGAYTVDVKDRLGGQWLLLVSTDIAAVDATAARITGHDVAKAPWLQMAKSMGLGEIDADAIELKGATLSELTMPWKQAEYKSAASLGAPAPTPTPTSKPAGTSFLSDHLAHALHV